MSTKLRINITFILSLIFFGIIVEYSAIVVFKRNFIEQRKIFGKTIIESIKKDLDFAISISNNEYLEKAVNDILRIPFIDFFEVYKGDRLVFKKGNIKNSVITVSDMNVLSINNSIITVKYILGLNISDFTISQRKFITGISFSIIFLILFTYLFLSFIITKFLEPVNHLVDAVKKLKGGEYKKINVKGTKELNLLIETYNNFVDNLKFKDEQLKNKIQELNEKIKEIQALQKMIINSEKLASIGTMAAGMAHEINNPLAGIKGTAEVLLYIDEVKDEKIRESLNAIIENSDRIAEIIKKLKGFSKITTGKEKVKIRYIIEDAISILSQSKKIPKNLKFKGNFNNSDAEILCNKNEIIQVFLNLIENSFDEIGENCEIEINIQEYVDKIEIIFCDNGKGIPDNIKDKIFDPFFTTKREKGTGLGLFICHKIITSHNGTIELIKKENKGACFKITYFKKEVQNGKENFNS